MSSQYVPQTIAQLPLVTMFTAPNPGPMTLEGTNTYLVGQNMAYIIDPGPDIASYIEALAAWLRETAASVAAILLTHGHPDHTSGAERLSRILGGIPVWASAAMADDIALVAAVDHRFGSRQRFQTDGDTLETLAMPGHTSDHVSFQLPGPRILFAGDTILGRGSSVVAPPDGNMEVYMRTLSELRALNPAIIAPGHGPIIMQPRATIDEYLEHRRRREQQILDVLEEGPADIDSLVSRIYIDTDPRLLDLARASVEAQLLKLESEKRVRRAGTTCQLA